METAAIQTNGLLEHLGSFAFVVTMTALSGASAGCSHQLYSPPTRMANLESARTAAPGETVVGVHAGGYSAVFDPAVVVGNVGVRRGIAPGKEVDADVTWGHLVQDDYSGMNRDVLAGRVGAKLGNQKGWAATYGGIGGGFAPEVGGFSALDVGGVISYPNCYVVPSLNATAFGSVPIAAKQVDFRNDAGEYIASSRAVWTYGFGLAGGIDIPLDRERCRQNLTPPRIQLGLGFNDFIRSDGTKRIESMTNSPSSPHTGGQFATVGLALGVEVPF